MFHQRVGGKIWRNLPAWGTPAPRSPGPGASGANRGPQNGGGGRRPPRPSWRRRRQVRRVWGAGAPPGRPIPPKVYHQLCWWPGFKPVQLPELLVFSHLLPKAGRGPGTKSFRSDISNERSHRTVLGLRRRQGRPEPGPPRKELAQIRGRDQNPWRVDQLRG